MNQIYTGMWDVLLGYDTDLHFENGDLMLSNGIDYIEREIYKLLITEPGDWKASPKIGCTPNVFTGSQNTREVGKRIESFLTDGLKDTVFPGQVSVRVVPTGYESIMIFVDIMMQNYEVDSLIFDFDFINGISKFNKYDSRVLDPISTTNYKINDISNMKRPNKYLTSMRENFLN
jgi:hypothetical protein